MTFVKSLLKTISVKSSADVSFLLSLLLNLLSIGAAVTEFQVPYFKPPLQNFLKFICSSKKVQGSNSNSMEKPKITYNTTVKVYFSFFMFKCNHGIPSPPCCIETL